MAAAALAACAPPPVRAPLEEEPFILSPGPPPSVREALALREAGGRASIERIGPTRRVPLVHARVADQPTLLLVDTGAYDHLLEGWFARELQDAEATGKTAAVSDHANRRVSVERWSRVKFALDGWGPLEPIRPLVTGDLVPGPRALGIGGILSPQRLVAGGAVVIDFPANEMVSTDSESARARVAARASSLGVARRCGDTYIISATVEGKPARLLVDTGASATDLKSSSPPGRALSGRSSVSRDMYAIGGAVATRMLSDARVSIEAFSGRLDVPLVEDRARGGGCATDGVVGMDILADCVVEIEDTEMRVGCG